MQQQIERQQASSEQASKPDGSPGDASPEHRHDGPAAAKHGAIKQAESRGNPVTLKEIAAASVIGAAKGGTG
jgi:hypothetical protein